MHWTELNWTEFNNWTWIWNTNKQPNWNPTLKEKQISIARILATNGPNSLSLRLHGSVVPRTKRIKQLTLHPRHGAHLPGHVWASSRAVRWMLSQDMSIYSHLEIQQTTCRFELLNTGGNSARALPASAAACPAAGCPATAGRPWRGRPAPVQKKRLYPPQRSCIVSEFLNAKIPSSGLAMRHKMPQECDQSWPIYAAHAHYLWWIRRSFSIPSAG